MAKKTGKMIYLLPNLLTSGNFFCGILSITFSLDEKFYFAAIAITVGMFFDALDGAAARRNKSTSAFGVQYDSLTDLVTFGVAPMVMMYNMGLNQLGAGGRMGLAIAFLYSVCTALRLARFNAQSGSGMKKSFTGLPSPAAACFLASYVMVTHEYGVLESFSKYTPVLMIIAAYLMISNVKYPRVSNAELRRKKPFVHLVVVLLIVAGMLLFIHEALFIIFAGFLLQGPLVKLHHVLKHRTDEPLPTEELQKGH
jgi:CDP-diacylglycerol---serine O-phosphatidyltransferase